MKIELIETGFFHADGGAMFGSIPKNSWARRYKCAEDNTCILTMRIALIIDGDRIILVDNGAGDKHLRLLQYYRFFDMVDLKDKLAERGISPEDVTDIVLTHLHFDHCGYSTSLNQTTGALRPNFPNATHWVSDAQWDTCINPHPLEKDSFRMENINAVAITGKLHIVRSEAQLTENVGLRLFGGHTPGQIVVYINSPEGPFVFPGDVVPLTPNVSPEWISAYDMFPMESYNEKIRLLEEAARLEQTLIYCHDAYNPMSMVKKIKEGIFKPVFDS